MKQMYEINSDGYLVAIHIDKLENILQLEATLNQPIYDEESEVWNDPVDKHRIIVVDPPNGLYSPRWDEEDVDVYDSFADATTIIKQGSWVNGLSEEEIAELNSPTKTVDDLKRELSESDYQIIKCYEYALAGLELPYDVQLPHEERKALRDQINAMEGQ